MQPAGKNVHDSYRIVTGIMINLVNRKIPIGENCHSQKVYGIFPICQFVQENCHMGQFLQDGEYVCLMSFFLSKASV